MGRGNESLCFYLDRIRTLVAMATYASHRLIMEKSGKLPIFAVLFEIFEFCFCRNVY